MSTPILSGTQSNVRAANTSGTLGTSATAASNGAYSASGKTIAENFQTFLQMLTTQLQNQSPLDPLDTNQFTAQLVQFTQVEQMLKSNQQLETLVNLQKTVQGSQALNYVGATVTVDGSTATLDASGAKWRFGVSKPASATVTITNTAGQTVYSGTFTMQAGEQQFTWDGKGKDGTVWPEASVAVTDILYWPGGQTVAVSTEVEGVVDTVDLTKQPPVLSMGNLDFTMDMIKRVSKAKSS